MKNTSVLCMAIGFSFVSMGSFGMQQDYRQVLSRYQKSLDESIVQDDIDNNVAVEVQNILACAEKTLASVSGYLYDTGVQDMAKKYAQLVRNEARWMRTECDAIPYTSTVFDISGMRRSVKRIQEYAERAHFWACHQR